MKKVWLKANAKINLTLDIEGISGGFHLIRSFVATINLCDKLILKKRKDSNIVIHDKFNLCECEAQKNNAYKSAKAFMEAFNVSGVDIYIKKKIPVGGGLGGSSADIAGTLKGMKKLFGISGDILSIANNLGSDSGYLIDGGYKIISGRGDIIEEVNAEKQKDIYLIIIPDREGISAKECYQEYDRLEEKAPPCTSMAKDKFQKGEEYFSYLKNDLYKPALRYLPQLREKINDLESVGAKKALMTGSGSCVYGIFTGRKDQKKGIKKLKAKYKNLIKAKTIR